MIRTSSTALILAPSKIKAWLDCGHHLVLKRCVEEDRSKGLSVFEILNREPRYSLAGWVKRISVPFGEDHALMSRG